MEDLGAGESLLLMIVVAYPLIAGIYLLTTEDTNKGVWLRYTLGAFGVVVGSMLLWTLAQMVIGKG